MQRLEVSGAVRPIYGSLGVKRLKLPPVESHGWISCTVLVANIYIGSQLEGYIMCLQDLYWQTGTDVAAWPATGTGPFLFTFHSYTSYIRIHSIRNCIQVPYIETDITYFWKWRLFFSFNSYYCLRIQEQIEIFVQIKADLFHLTKF